jgi:hypothetical protein
MNEDKARIRVLEAALRDVLSLKDAREELRLADKGIGSAVEPGATFLSARATLGPGSQAAQDRIEEYHGDSMVDFEADLAQALDDGRLLATMAEQYKARAEATGKALRKLVNVYVKNLGTKHEFISCITPITPNSVPPYWRQAIAALVDAEQPAPEKKP